MDILYVYGKRNKALDDFELKCSLRSIAEHGKNIDRVYVVGKCPSWLSDEVIKIPHYKQFFEHPKNQGEKNVNIAENVFYAIDHSDIGENFFVSHDDHFYIKDVDFDNYPRYAREFGGSGEIITRKHADSEYRNFLADTREFLEKHNLPTINFALHRNMLLSREALENIRELYNESIKEGKPIELYILAINWELANRPFEYKIVKDSKIMADDQWWKSEDENAEVFSTSDFKKNSLARKKLKKIFPNKCKYEK